MCNFDENICYPKGFQRNCNSSRIFNQCDKDGNLLVKYNFSQNRCEDVRC